MRCRALVLAVFVLAGCTDEPAETSAKAHTAMVETAAVDTVITCYANPELLFKMYCTSCHGQSYALPARKLWGTRLAQEDGRVLLVDEAFIRESLLEPTAAITLGFQPIMPTFRGHFRDRDVAMIVEYYKANADVAPVETR